MTKEAKDLVVGDKIKAGETVAEVKAVRYMDETVQCHGMAAVDNVNKTYTRKMLTFDGQPEISAINLQAFIDQGSITIL